MSLLRKTSAIMISVTLGVNFVACSNTTLTTNAEAENESSTESSNANEEAVETLLVSYEQDSESLTFNNSLWNYDKENDVYWQINIVYCSDAETTGYESMGIYVPGAYMNAEANGDGTYTCTVNTEGEVSGYTSQTAPIVFPVNTGGYSAQEAPTSYNYDSVSSYIESGFIYVYSGMRGRNNGYTEDGSLAYSGGAPWGVTDLKAAVRYYRYNEKLLPGNTDSIFTFGHSGGGAQSSIIGATGDSELYYEYLTSIGAAMYDKDGNYISDAICGTMTWCPITSLDYADEAYEWNMGQYSTEGTRSDDTWTSALSDDLAESFASYINELGLTDENGNTLVLEESTDGIYASGSYYDYILSVIENSLNNFLSDTEFPYTQSNSFKMDGGFGAGALRGNIDTTSGATTTEGTMSNKLGEGEISDDIMAIRGNKMNSSTSEPKTYETVGDYINELNADGEWIEYDAETNTANIISIEDFVNHCKNAGKDVGAFDGLEASEAENMLFGNDDSDTSHFDSVLADLLEENATVYATYSDWDESIIEEYASDLTSTDEFGNSIEERQNMYNPMYYLDNYYDGYETSNVATFWRIRTGITQDDTALTVEANLALALENYAGVEDVDFETVWAQGHTTAERTGDSTENFITWVNQCLNQ